MGRVVLASCLFFALPAFGFGAIDKFSFAQVVYSGNWNPRPSGIRRLLWEIEKRTSIDTSRPTQVLLGETGALRQSPLLYLTGDRALPSFSDSELGNLRSHLLGGGLLFVDNSSTGNDADAGGAFDRSFRLMARQLFPSRPLERLPVDHVLYKSFYLLRTPAGRVAATPYLEAIVDPADKRVLVVYSQNDLGGAWARDSVGKWEYEVFPGGDQQREMAFRFGINLVMYALCQDYKTDQVHVPFILRRRKWQPQP